MIEKKESLGSNLSFMYHFDDFRTLGILKDYLSYSSRPLFWRQRYPQPSGLSQQGYNPTRSEYLKIIK
ncbi:hypothetical protein HanIR_Chr02g0092041 [Helianthus annuus]|nr:hypothetical protein HanIR_Chr02g0092041 [Helianthus annuus]